MVTRIDRPEDLMRGVVTFDVGEGQFLTVSARDLREYGLELILRHHGIEPPTGRLPVYQYDKKIGTVPAAFDPLNIRSSTFLYDPRPGDFKFEDGKWVANRTMCPGDFEAIEGFAWDRN